VKNAEKNVLHRHPGENTEKSFAPWYVEKRKQKPKAKDVRISEHGTKSIGIVFHKQEVCDIIFSKLKIKNVNYVGIMNMIFVLICITLTKIQKTIQLKISRYYIVCATKNYTKRS
jgi:hypothetical protein